MINDFLATLDNIATAPSGVVWPTFTARQLSSVEVTIRTAVIGVNLSREQTFSRCLQLVNLVNESPLASYITARDPRITYSRQADNSRFATSGPAVLYTGSGGSPASVNLALLATTPDIGAWVLQPTSGISVTVTDDRGVSLVSAVSFSGGISSPITLPNGGGVVQLVGTSISSLDTWQLSYRAPGASWVTQALQRVKLVEPRAIMNADLTAWYDRDPLAIDRLAAVVAALGSA